MNHVTKRNLIIVGIVVLIIVPSAIFLYPRISGRGNIFQSGKEKSSIENLLSEHELNDEVLSGVVIYVSPSAGLITVEMEKIGDIILPQEYKRKDLIITNDTKIFEEKDGMKTEASAGIIAENDTVEFLVLSAKGMALERRLTAKEIDVQK